MQQLPDSETHFVIEPAALAYLRVQKGRIWDLSPGAWHKGYREHLLATYDSLAPYLPATCGSILDVGSGLGGIDVLISRHYKVNTPYVPPPVVHLLDGLADPPVMHLHRETFNHMGVARDFLAANGLDVARFHGYGTDVDTPLQRYDVICSFGAWCFHLPPELYLRFVRTACHPETILVLEVRAQKDMWRAQLEHYFQEIACVHGAAKFNRIVYGVRE